MVDKLGSPYDVFLTSPLEEKYIHILLLTDCINAYQACQQMQFKSELRMAKIHLSFLRDLMGLLNLSYVTAWYNVADTGAKMESNSHVFYALGRPNRFAISFLPRQEFNSTRASPVDAESASNFMGKQYP